MTKRANSIVGDTQSHNNRPASDFYPTKPSITIPILKTLDLSGQGWEPACGQGHIHKLLPEGTWASDLYDYGYGESAIDFLMEFRECDWIITNPPFKYAQQFIEHSLMCIRDGGFVAMFLKLQFLEGVERSKWLARSGLKYVYVFGRRVRLDAEIAGKDNGGMLSFAWYVWEQGYKGEPILRWL